MKRFLFALMFLACPFIAAFAQGDGLQSKKFEIGATLLYSPTRNTTNSEINFGYTIKERLALNLTVNFLDLGLKKYTFGETVSVALSPFPMSRFYMKPEIGVGAVHGYFNGDDSGIATKCQFPVGVTVGFLAYENFACALVAKYDFITNLANVFLCGFKFAACF